MKRFTHIIIPLVLVAVASACYIYLIKTPNMPEKTEAKPTEVQVDYIEAMPQSFTITLRSRGTVLPVNSALLSSEVSGRVVEVSNSFKRGGFVRRGEIILKIGSEDYQENLIRAKAGLASAKLALATELARSDQAAQNWSLLGLGDGSPLALRKPQLTESKAALKAAEAEVSRARRELSHTIVVTPYDLLIQEKLVNLHEQVAAGTQLCKIMGIEAAEVHLPLTDEQYSLLDLQFPNKSGSGPQVTILATIGGTSYKWPGRIIRSTHISDPDTRLVHVVARIKDPYYLQVGDKNSVNLKQPLRIGMFVTAEITGKSFANTIVLPENAIHEGEFVWLIDENNRLKKRRIEPTISHEGAVIVESGLSPLDRVCLGDLSYELAENSVVKPQKLQETKEHQKLAGIGYE